MDSPPHPLQTGKSAAETDGNLPAFLFSTMIAFDTSFLSLWLANWISTSDLFSLHLFGVGLVLGASVLFNRRAIFSACLEAALCLLAGPLGTIVLQIARLGLVLPATNPDYLKELDNDLQGPVSMPDAMHEMHVQGRRSKPHKAENQSYADIIRHGDLLRHNEIIAAISRNYRPEMYPVLSLALGSSSPALKVQAAAVFSKLRRTLGDAANDLLATNMAMLTHDSAQDYHERVLNVARSGFVDAGKVQALMERAREIEDFGLLTGDRSGLPKTDARYAKKLQRNLLKQGPRLKRYACGGLG